MARLDLKTSGRSRKKPGPSPCFHIVLQKPKTEIRAKTKMLNTRVLKKTNWKLIKPKTDLRSAAFSQNTQNTQGTQSLVLKNARNTEHTQSMLRSAAFSQNTQSLVLKNWPSKRSRTASPSCPWMLSWAEWLYHNTI